MRGRIATSSKKLSDIILNPLMHFFMMRNMHKDPKRGKKEGGSCH
ncbi:DUF2933 domain-containing protein [Candidatus Woesearchaeota archaeon]|nr:DUF2933 domain-containing protein [Candidatus Woesearchaeota archaeon]